MFSEVHEKLVEIVGEERVSGKDFELHAYSRDLGPARPKLASFVVRPEETDEIAKIVKLANRYKIPVYVRGCGCSHWAAWLPIKGGILLDMTSMDRIIEIDKENLIAVVESGCTWFKLMEELRKNKLTYLLSEIGGPAMTVVGSVIKAGGGNYGTCKFGFHGQMDVLGFEVVLPTGEVVKTGSWVMSNMPPIRRVGLGPDLTGLFIGSEGILGIATKCAIRIRPLPQHEEFLYFEFKNWEDIVNVADEVTYLTGDEMAHTIDCGELAAEPSKITARIAVFGYERAIIEYRKNKILNLCLKNNGIEGDVENASAFFNKVVSGLHDIFVAGVWHFPGCGSVPMRELPRYVEAWREIVKKHGFLKSSFGAWPFPRGWGVYALFFYSELTEYEKLMAISDEINRRFFEMGFIPYGIGGSEGLQPYFREKCDPSYYKLIKGIKSYLDPNNILQPGIIVE
ncbi:MAG: FAD-binding oxidoreductase [Candidatus Brockarchaeota archaeon]|nr:FAD-binding oxidoreductase [Candidatus Brockarchaeota archaeon]